nr:MBL fold metallo-hydrolase [Rhodothermus marinus]
MLFRQIFDPKLAQYAYLIGCQQTKEAIVIDPERDVDQYLRLAEEEGLRIVAVAETHIHADFLSGARELAERVGARLYLSAEGEADGWASNWAKNGRYDVTFLRDGDTFRIGNIEFRAVHTPGHTPEHLCYLVTDRGGGATEPMGIVTGDFVFVGDLGRPDLLESAARISGMKELRPAGSISPCCASWNCPTICRSGPAMGPDRPVARRWVPCPNRRWVTRSVSTPRWPRRVRAKTPLCRPS